VGRDKFGSNVLVDFNQRAEDKTNGSILILGNSDQGILSAEADPVQPAGVGHERHLSGSVDGV